jgi:hypothetical protein
MPAGGVTMILAQLGNALTTYRTGWPAVMRRRDLLSPESLSGDIRKGRSLTVAALSQA